MATIEEKKTTAQVSETNNSYLNVSNAQGEPIDLEQYEIKDQELHQKFVH